ncbi:MAG: hypothetical protein ACPLPS_09295, partial [bacterium]
MREDFSYEEFFEKEALPPPEGLKGPFQLLKESLNLYCSNFKFIVGVWGIPVGLFIVYDDLSYLSSFTSLNYSPFLPFLKFFLYIIALFFSLLASIGFLLNLEEKTSLTTAFKKSWRFSLPFLWVVIVCKLIWVGGWILGFIPGILFYIWFSLAVFAFLFEDKRGFSALQRSKQLVRGKFWWVFLRILFLGLILGILNYGLAFLATFKINYIPLSYFLMKIVLSFLQIFNAPIFFIFTYLIYKDLREFKVEEPYKEPSFASRALFLIMGIVGVIPLLFLICFFSFNILWGRDVPPIDDSDLRLSRVDIPREENGWFDILEALKKRVLINDPTYSQLYFDMQIGRRLTTKEARYFMKSNEESYRVFQRALKRPYLQIPELEEPSKWGPPGDAIILSLFSKVRELGRWGIVRADYLFAEGDEREAFQWYLNVERLSQAFKSSPRPAGLSQWLVAIALTHSALSSLRKRLGEENLSSSELKRFAKELEVVAGNQEGLKRAFKMEYIFFCNSISWIESIFYKKARTEEEEETKEVLRSNLPSIPSFGSAYYKPNKTRLLMAEIYREMIQNVDKPFKEMKFPYEEEERETSSNFTSSFSKFFGYFFKENAIGAMIVSELIEPVKRILTLYCLDKFSLEATATLLALRAYKK